MRIIPSTIYDAKSEAEEKVFRLLEKTSFGEGAVAIHSLNVPEHEYKRWSELDFVILSPSGIFVLEIKGGNVARGEDGIWTFTNRFGQEHRKSEGPFDQVNSGMFAFEKMLEKKFPYKFTKKVCFGWGVLFPDKPFNISTIEVPPETILDSSKFKNLDNLNEYLEGLAMYWQRKTNIGRKSDYEIGRTIQYLRPIFDLVPTLASKIGEISNRQVSLTEEQYTYLDSIQESERIVCEGGAGTGKTFMAAEVVRSESYKGKKVAFLCKGYVFSRYMASRLDSEQVDVFDIDSITARVDGGGSPEYEVLVVDEGQDLLDFGSFDVMNSILAGGLENGRWRFFMDYINQSAITAFEAKEDAYQWLRSCQATPLKLKRNCRNTVQIVHQTMMTTGADIGESIIEGEGPKATFVYPESPREAARMLSSQLTEWVDNMDVAPGQITVLSPSPIDNSCLQFISHRWRSIIQIVGKDVFHGWGNQLTYSTIENFKGLENNCIAVIDLESFDGGKKSISELYVGMTRANALLWVAVSGVAREKFDSVRVSNAIEMTKGATGR
mgnify:CR=1 FL=1